VVQRSAPAALDSPHERAIVVGRVLAEL
jgi:hypothetical protein